MVLVMKAVSVPLRIFVCRGGVSRKDLALARRMGMEGKTYRSPPRKLLRFFERSRDNWKRKCQKAKVVVKRLSNRVRQLETSRNLWKQRAKQNEEQLRKIQEQCEASKNAAA